MILIEIFVLMIIQFLFFFSCHVFHIKNETFDCNKSNNVKYNIFNFITGNQLQILLLMNFRMDESARGAQIILRNKSMIVYVCIFHTRVNLNIC